MLIKIFFTNSIGTLVSRIFGFIRDMLSASILGANIYSDIFFVAFKFPNLFRRIFAEGAFTQSFIPSFIKTPRKALFTYTIFTRFFLFLIFFSLIVTLFSEFFAKIIAFGFDKETITLSAPFVAINFYYLPLIFCVTLFGSLLQYKHHFAVTAFSTALLNIGMIGALLFFQGYDKKTIVYALSYGVLVGGILQVIVHLIALKKDNFCRLFTLAFRHRKKKDALLKESNKNFNRAFFHSILGNSTPQIVSFVDTTLASFLISGSISYLYYGNRIFQLPLALFAIALTTGIFPKMTRLLKANNEIEASKLLSQGFWILAFLLTTSTLGGYMLSHEIVWLLFEHGSFSKEDTLNTGFILAMYMIGLVPFGLAKLFSLWLYARMRQKEAAVIAAYSLVANLLFSLALIKPMGAAGLALAGSLAGCVLLFFTLRSFGFRAFFAILYSKKLMILLALLLLEWVILRYAKELIHAYL
ncbi:murein biosynthesis integral membrane protein MurJ [Sulfurospirillum barnesii]|uniref:Probable lipid II flippase MurJ n=1 Tax=Sulfurospirillum barnesii (strain ATCC 700032 / DSM 10660 / SES-3) TaxID=760154 RepID=I3XX31_SULBS|nr:murein biosynthesis integral membrane protein MurJ [Sulfurospirillum barnesii]AFL68505.1 integral membrane protein MviN [Sulfurospirillum barnesii SES-3]